jgi:hypothetical protein
MIGKNIIIINTDGFLINLMRFFITKACMVEQEINIESDHGLEICLVLSADANKLSLELFSTINPFKDDSFELFGSIMVPLLSFQQLLCNTFYMHLVSEESKAVVHVHGSPKKVFLI